MTESILSILAVCATLALSQLSPGPDVFFVFRTSLAQGFRRGVAVALGINLGFLIQSIIACTIGSWVLEQSWSHWLIFGAAAWLLYLAWKIFPKRSVKSIHLGTEQEEREGFLTLVGQGFLCNILNPKCMLFILALSTDALRSHSAISWYMPTLVGSLFLASLAGWTLWSGLLQWTPLRRAYLRHTRAVDTVFSVILAVFALLLLLRNEP